MPKQPIFGQGRSFAQRDQGSPAEGGAELSSAPPNIHAVAYIRVSTEEQAREGLSLETQEKRIRAFAESQNWELKEIFRDEGFSGSKLDRPDLKRLIDSASHRDWQVVLTYRVDRLSRRQRDLWYLIEDVFEKNCIGFKSVSEPFDTTTAQGKAFLGMLAVFAQLERDTIAERTADALRFRRSIGEPCGRAPFGYRYSSAHGLERDVAQQSIISRAKRLRRRGKTLRQIAQQLNLALGTVFSITRKRSRDCKHNSAKRIGKECRSQNGRFMNKVGDLTPVISSGGRR